MERRSLKERNERVKHLGLKAQKKIETVNGEIYTS